jgi:hypothetical protein
MVEIKVKGSERQLVVQEKGERLGEIGFAPEVGAWVADAGGVWRTCSSVEEAIDFVEAVWSPRSEVKRKLAPPVEGTSGGALLPP